MNAKTADRSGVDGRKPFFPNFFRVVRRFSGHVRGQR